MYGTQWGKRNSLSVLAEDMKISDKMEDLDTEEWKILEWS
jgi:hypothetical protein